MRDFLSRAINTVWPSGVGLTLAGDQLLTLRQFQRRGDRGFNASPLATRDLQDLVVEIVDAACEKHGQAPNRAVYVAMVEAVDQLLFIEGIIAPEIDWDRVDTSFTYHDAIRTRLTARAHFFSDYDRHIGILRRKLVAIFAGLLNHLPEYLFEDVDAGGPAFNAALHDCVEELGEALDRLFITYEDDDLVSASLCGEVRNLLIENILQVSGIDPKSRANATRRIISPSQSDATSPRELTTKYLRDTPYAAFLKTSVPFVIPEKARFEHCHILGGTGHGKTQLLQHMIFAELERARTECRSIVVIDSQGDLIRKLSRLQVFSPLVEDSLFDCLCFIDPTDVEYPASLNMFDLNRERLSAYDKVAKEKVLNGTVELYENFFGSLLGAELTQKQGVIFKYLARLMLEIPEANIHTLRDLMDDAEPFIPYMEQLRGSARYFFEREFFDRSFAPTKKQISKRLWGVLATPSFERMFAQPRNKVDMFELLNRGSIILINTAKDLLKQEGCELFGRFFLSMIAQAAMERSIIPEDERTPTTIYVDEAQEYFDDNIGILLAQARKYKISICAGNQTLDQLSPGLRAAFMSNVGTKIVGGLSAKDANVFAAEMHTTTEFLQSLRKRESVTEFALHVRHHTPRALRIEVPLGFLESRETLTDAEYEELVDHSREQFSEPYEESAGDVMPFKQTSRKPLFNEEPRVTKAESEQAHQVKEERPADEPPPQALKNIKPPSEPEVARSQQPRVPPAMGRGGREHRYVQEMLKGLAEQQGYLARIEDEILDGERFIDVSLTRGDERIACEIAITTPPEKEVENIRKCIAAGYPTVWVISSNHKHLAAIRKLAEVTFSEGAVLQLRFLKPEDLPAAFAENPSPAIQATTIRGYRVRVKKSDASFDETKTRRATVAEVLAKSIAEREK